MIFRNIFQDGHVTIQTLNLRNATRHCASFKSFVQNLLAASIESGLCVRTRRRTCRCRLFRLLLRVLTAKTFCHFHFSQKEEKKKLHRFRSVLVGLLLRGVRRLQKSHKYAQKSSLFCQLLQHVHNFVLHVFLENITRFMLWYFALVTLDT